MSEVPTGRMTIDEYLAWAEDRPGRYELVWARVFAMAPERARHAKAKFAAQAALSSAIERAGILCHMLPDGMTVRIDRDTAFEPDALAYCGEELPGDAIEVAEPVVVVEILSPSTRLYDTGSKLAGLFQAAERRTHPAPDTDAAPYRAYAAAGARRSPPGSLAGARCAWTRPASTCRSKSMFGAAAFGHREDGKVSEISSGPYERDVPRLRAETGLAGIDWSTDR